MGAHWSMVIEVVKNKYNFITNYTYTKQQVKMVLMTTIHAFRDSFRGVLNLQYTFEIFEGYVMKLKNMHQQAKRCCSQTPYLV